MMEQEKPFKTIEVIDNDTKQVCKIACMSCIRGHRTTSCGIPVCRTKIFWTVKRPGRPSNSCTCRFHSSGVCKCVTAIPKCPHKSKKGEKRTSECRCDEQGRFCCLLEPEHWETLMLLQKPNVNFFQNRDALEAWQISQTALNNPETPASNYFSATPQRTGSCCGTPTTQSTPRIARSIAPSPSDAASPQSTTIVPRFGFMGVGAPMGQTHTSPDVMSWDGETPIAPRDYHAAETAQPEEVVQGSCCQGTQAYTPPSSHAYAQPAYQPAFSEAYPPYSGAHMAPQPAFDFDRWNQNYQVYQFPNAICQNCGLNGCTCRSCPPLMQNFQNTSWAQSCGRRHARIAPMPPPPPPSQQQQLPHPMHHIPPNMQLPQPLQMQHRQQQQLQHTQAPHIHHNQPPPMHSLPLETIHSPLPAFDHHPISPEQSDPLAYSDFLMHELDRPSHVADDHMFGG